MGRDIEENKKDTTVVDDDVEENNRPTAFETYAEESNSK